MNEIKSNKPFKRVKSCVNFGLGAFSPVKSRVLYDEARHGKALEGLLKRYFG